MQLALAFTLLSPLPAAAQKAPTLTMQPQHRWHEKAREIYARAIAFQSVEGRNQSPQLAEYLAGEFRAAGLSNIVIKPHDGTASLILRWPAAHPSGRKAMLLMAHLDVVEARREDWSRDPFKLVEEDGYFYGRGTLDDKQGVAAITATLLRLRAEGFEPDREIIVLFTGDEESSWHGADLAANEWLDLSTIDFALNADGGFGAYLADGTPLGFSIETSEKVSQSFAFTAVNPGGHSSRPRPDNAIYDLMRALQRLEQHRFEPMLNDTTRAMFTNRLRTADPALAAAIRRWLADPSDGEAADIIEAAPTEVGLTRTRCVATRLEAGHADNALPQLARATVNCRMFPGSDPATLLETLRALALPDKVKVEPIDQARATQASPLRDDVVAAHATAVHARHPGVPAVPFMSTGASDGLYFRARGVPVYGIDGAWSIIPADERAHGRDERLPVRAFYENVDHWTDMVRRLAAPIRNQRAYRGSNPSAFATAVHGTSLKF